MDLSDLAESASGFLAEHPGVSWWIDEADLAGRGLRIVVRSANATDREAEVEVAPGAELFRYAFRGHSHTDCAYSDEYRVEALQDRLTAAIACVTGPVRLVIDLTGGRTLRSHLTIPEGSFGARDEIVHGPAFRVIARLRRRPIERRIVELTAIG